MLNDIGSVFGEGSATVGDWAWDELSGGAGSGCCCAWSAAGIDGHSYFK